VLGKGVLRFHAVYWPAMLLSAGLAPPTRLYVHDYLTVDGRKISKSAGDAVDPVELVDAYGTDPLRWALLRTVPKVGDTDFTVAALVERTNTELVNGLGNLVNRVTSMVHRYRDGVPPAEPTGELVGAGDGLERELALAVADFDFRRATGVVWDQVVAANRYVNQTKPWALAGAGDPALAGVLAELLAACRRIGVLLEPFLPDTARRIARRCTADGGTLPPPRPLFTRLVAPTGAVG
jgi:methionyl-tRNA synthetase